MEYYHFLLLIDFSFMDIIIYNMRNHLKLGPCKPVKLSAKSRKWI